MAEKSLDERVATLEAEFEEFEKSSDAALDAKLDAKLKPLKADLAIIRHAVAVLVNRVN
jgi:hypothetical protein